MNKEEIKGLIAMAMITDRMLEIIDEHRADDNITLKEIRDKWNEEYKINGLKAEKFPFINVHQYLINLFPRIVLPQAFDKEMGKVKISKLSDEWIIKNIIIKDERTKRENYTLNDFVTRLRNSISHGNFEIDYLTYHFKDISISKGKGKGKEKVVFECSLTYAELRSFVGAFTKWVNTQYEQLHL